MGELRTSYEMDEHTEETVQELAHFLLAKERANARIAAIRRTDNELRALVASELKDFEVSLSRLRKQAETMIKISPRISESLPSGSSTAHGSRQREVNP